MTSLTCFHNFCSVPGNLGGVVGSESGHIGRNWLNPACEKDFPSLNRPRVTMCKPRFDGGVYISFFVRAFSKVLTTTAF